MLGIGFRLPTCPEPPLLPKFLTLNNWLLLQMLLSLVGQLLNTTLMWLNYASDDLAEA